MKKLFFLALTAPVLAQSQHAVRVDNSPKQTVNDTVVWLNDFIAKNAGFSLSRTTTTTAVSSAQPGTAHAEKPVDKPVQGKLIYRFHTSDTCHISWQAVPSGDDEIKMLYPGIDEDEDLATIVPDSIYLQPFDLQTVAGAGTSESAEGGSITTTIQPGAPNYWKLSAHYVYGFHGPDEPFGFIFSDAEAALHVADVLDQAVNLCRGPHSSEMHEGEGCDSSPTIKVEKYIANLPPPSLVTYINHGDVAVSCVVTQYAHYFSGKKLFRTASAAFDISPGGTWSGNFGIFASPLPGAGTELSCYPKGSVDIQRNSCSDLYHPFRWDNPKNPNEPATPHPPANGLQRR